MLKTYKLEQKKHSLMGMHLLKIKWLDFLFLFQQVFLRKKNSQKNKAIEEL
jgi:hypothetical protein